MVIYFDAWNADKTECWLVSFPIRDCFEMRDLKAHAKWLLSRQGIDISTVRVRLARGFNR